MVRTRHKLVGQVFTEIDLLDAFEYARSKGSFGLPHASRYRYRYRYMLNSACGAFVERIHKQQFGVQRGLFRVEGILDYPSNQTCLRSRCVDVSHRSRCVDVSLVAVCTVYVAISMATVMLTLARVLAVAVASICSLTHNYIRIPVLVLTAPFAYIHVSVAITNTRCASGLGGLS